MRAVVYASYGPPEVLWITDMDRPNPKPAEVRIRVIATTVTSSDCYVRGLKFPPALRLLSVERAELSQLATVSSASTSNGSAATPRLCTGPRTRYSERAPANLTNSEAAALPFGGPASRSEAAS